MKKDGNLPGFPYGAVYYRVSNPPKKDWDRDFATAKEDSNNIFRHWFLWSAIERSPGVHTWDDYDRLLDLAAKNGMKTIIAEMIGIAPEWTARVYHQARLEKADGSLSEPGMHVSCAVGGLEMCLDEPALRQKAQEFLTALVERYKDHPGLGGYDIWNECNYRENTCYCPSSRNAFIDWCKKKYGQMEAVREAWGRPSLSSWENISPPRHLQPYNSTLDWLKFRIDNGFEKMKWRADIIASIDPNHRITAHGLGQGLKLMASSGADDWRAASLVESFGLTWGSCRHGDEAWKQPQAFDLTRCASRGKTFWHAECYGGPLWFASNVLNKPRNQGRICYPEDIRYWNLTSYMHGARGTIFLRWRPLLDGPLFGAFGPYAMDGSRTDRSRMSTGIAEWAQAEEQQELWKSIPIQGQVGILFNPDAQLFTYAQQLNTDFFTQSYQGAYRGFYDNNIQADFVHPSDMDAWDFLYLPYPVCMSEEFGGKLEQWVKSGGTLVCEGCPAYWDERTHVGAVQPNLGLDGLFGAREEYVEFTPDLLDHLELVVLGASVPGGPYLQTYTPTAGKAVGWYMDGRVAAVMNKYGKGRTLLIGTMPGWGYSKHDGNGYAAFFRSLMDFARVLPHLTVSDARIRARLQDGEGGTYLWVANSTRQEIPVVIAFSDVWSLMGICTVRGAQAELNGKELQLKVPARDVTIIKIKK